MQTFFVIFAFLLLLSHCAFAQQYRISTVAGIPETVGYTDDVLATSGKLNYPSDVAIHPVSGDIYIVDTYNQIIRKLWEVRNSIKINGYEYNNIYFIVFIFILLSLVWCWYLFICK
jgi:hypothetical protein